MAEQWAVLRSAFLRQESALIFHLKNHYALIFALREWTEECTDSASVNLEEGGSVPPGPWPGPAVGNPCASDAADPKAVGVSKEPGAKGDLGTFESGGLDAKGTSEEASASAAPVPPARRGRVVRQLLTSRRGQRPSAWIDFDEARATMIGWDGYKIMLIERRA